VTSASPSSRKRFWQDPYLSELGTHVARVAGTTVVLEETIFFAESGGQESDSGTIGGLPVLEAKHAGGEIEYRMPDGHGLAAGDAVQVRIDWPRRYALMRLHFAAELVLEIVSQMRPGIVKIGAHIAADKARIDFESAENVAGLFDAIQERVTAIVAADEAIESAFSDVLHQRRYWRISGFASVPCGGTHLRRTGEVGTLHLRRKNVGRGKERIEIRLLA
jgi:Ser-tRNA(Ala) deacylase AlaX